MNSTLIATNLVAALFIIVIIISLYEVPKEVLRPTRLFRICMWMTWVGLLGEIAIYLIDGKANLSALLTGLNLAEYILLDLITLIYAYYLDFLIEESERHITRRLAYTITVLCSAEIIFYIIGVITGNLFKIEEGHFVAGPWHNFEAVACGFCFLLMCVLYLFKYRTFRIKSRFFVVLIVAVPLAATVLLHVDPNERFGFLGAAVSMNVIYAIIESKIIAEAVANAKMYNEMSENDMLTGLKNRRGYQQILDSFKGEEKVGIAFADVNSLKSVNDTLGHEAGDNLIKKVASILKDTVPEGTACRISGDEFVCIVKNAEEVAFSVSMKRLSQVLNENDKIAAFGYDFGEGKNIYDVIKSAERMMYADKEKYYRETGKDRRR